MRAAPELNSRSTAGGEVERLGHNHWCLRIPAGPAGRYRWAQLDDYLHLPRASFRSRPPLALHLRARVSHPDLEGTWGFGFWNDPFSAGLGLGGAVRQLPALPNACWFFYASPPNYLALRDDHPAQGFLTATFSSPTVSPRGKSPDFSALLLLPTAGRGDPAPTEDRAVPLMAWPRAARTIRRLARRFIGEAAASVEVTPTEWHAYGLEWCSDAVHFSLDGQPLWETTIAPRGRLGLVIWIDNQYAAFPPGGRLRFGTLATAEPGWLEVADVEVEVP